MDALICEEWCFLCGGSTFYSYVYFLFFFGSSKATVSICEIQAYQANVSVFARLHNPTLNGG